METIGMWNLENMTPALEGFSMALFTRVLGWSKEEVETFLTRQFIALENLNINTRNLS